MIVVVCNVYMYHNASRRMIVMVCSVYMKHYIRLHDYYAVGEYGLLMASCIVCGA